MSPHSLAEAWNVEAFQRGVTEATPGYDDAQNLFYAGAAAFLAMVAAAGRDGFYDLAVITQAELKEYLDGFAP
ncbi:MAG TPA: hypothetical protein VFB50_04145 [Chloroflexota bacterium]|nr:hypothetical protein [Chloroflexota bacterium]